MGTDQAIHLAQEPKKAVLSLTADYAFLDPLRKFLTGMCAATGFDSRWTHRLQTVIDELINNAIEHGSLPGAAIEITMEAHPKRHLSISIADAGKKSEGPSVESLKERVQQEVTHGAANLSSRGRGFMIINQWTDELTFEQNERGGTTVRVLKKFEEPTPEPKAAAAPAAEPAVNGTSLTASDDDLRQNNGVFILDI